MRNGPVLVALAAALLGVTPARAEAPVAKVSVAVAPSRVWAVPGDGLNKVNFDLLVTNEGTAPVEIVELRLSVFDSKGAFVTGRELNRLGMIPSIQSLQTREVEPGKTVQLLNPFHEFPADVELATLRCALVCMPRGNSEEEPAGAKPVEVEFTVRPEPLKVKTALSLPLKGKVYVWDGHEYYAHHRRIDMTHPLILQLGIKNNISRYGLDFMAVDAEGRRFKGAGENLEDYHIFGRVIHAPAAGTVEDCVDGRPDSPIGEMLVDYEEIMRTKDLRLFGGNFVILDHGNGERSYFAHMKQGSVKVKKGDRVAAGQPLGQVGSSGDSAEPHLHYHLLSGQGLDAELLPPLFRDYTLHLGGRAGKVRSGVPDTGDLVESR